MSNRRSWVRQYATTCIFGASDGLLAALAVSLATASRGRTAVLLSLFGVGIAEAFGMAVADFLAKEKPEVGWQQSAVMGAATGVAILLVGFPWLITSGSSAEFGSILVALMLSAAIARARAEHRWTDWAQTFGLLATVATLTGAVGHA